MKKNLLYVLCTYLLYLKMIILMPAKRDDYKNGIANTTTAAIEAS